MTAPFLGSEALADGTLNRHQLRTRFRTLYPNVYVPKTSEPTLEQRTVGAWLWSGRRAVIAGPAAAALHGAKWIDPSIPIDLIHDNPRQPRGITTRRDTLLPGETVVIGGMLLTSSARTAFDIGRRSPTNRGVAHLDALLRATGCTVADIADLANRHRGARGLRRLEATLPLVDAGAQSPKETWLRLLIVRDGLPKPTTQIPVLADDGTPLAYLDMGWEEWMVAVEYDGDQHRTDRRQYVRDIRRLELLAELGWIVIRVVAEDGTAEILRRIRTALTARQSSVRSRRKAS
ncbi:hypothetical protein LTT02_15085 [Mycolicibacterium smegmatis]|uniref:DUF559 domain-containing protein n=1 Tax=Mycolicibacterium smegmatis (strain MKD8) TaxID=1214915 RepID=A0A2U9PJB8_MYCSE|nr:hypothetical protein [Mycolicibacterium smegmatis]AWT51844.1 hypothetical protein D806_008540 [Mycolicibacterium smegmatis MKD8]MDF1901912.1 hypothetical protein [Mycolicibacterium smegmatis]MDF1905836.1 hypothetical protein [Mycolicibacterium smegmatis]MDF1920768.1 hypothetical protein [Mycolicibacterium smegmatis]MDF1926784.1 hypothetical protein [Mycolicibacterium smegmatis]